MKNIKCNTHTSESLTHCCCSTLCVFNRCGRPLLVREQCRAGVLRRWGPRGFHSGAPGARSPRHPRQERQIPAWRPGGHAEGRRTQPEQLGPVGILTQPKMSPNSDSSHRWVHRLLFTHRANINTLSKVKLCGTVRCERQLLTREELQPVLISSHFFSPSCYKEVATESEKTVREYLTIFSQEKSWWSEQCWVTLILKKCEWIVFCVVPLDVFQWACAARLNYCLNR